MLVVLCSSSYDYMNNYPKTESPKTIANFLLNLSLALAQDRGSANVCI